MITANDSDRFCTECGGDGRVKYEPVKPGGAWVSERCRCQPKQTESDREFYTRRMAEAQAEADRLMDLREKSAMAPMAAE